MVFTVNEIKSVVNLKIKFEQFALSTIIKDQKQSFNDC